jgi:hypothetical protein
MLNQYHNHYVATNEHDLTDNLIIEAIQMKGINVKYLSRTHNDFDFLYGEDPTSSFYNATEIEMYPAEVNGFGGDGELMSKFGLEVRDTATFIVNKTRFKQEFPDFIRPREGDLLFMPYTNAILEIKFVNHESPFFQQGKQFLYELKVETFEISHEDIMTGDTEIDELVSGILNFDPSTETEPFGDNEEIEDLACKVTKFNPANPFGVN